MIHKLSSYCCGPFKKREFWLCFIFKPTYKPSVKIILFYSVVAWRKLLLTCFYVSEENCDIKSISTLHNTYFQSALFYLSSITDCPRGTFYFVFINYIIMFNILDGKYSYLVNTWNMCNFIAWFDTIKHSIGFGFLVLIWAFRNQFDGWR